MTKMRYDSGVFYSVRCSVISGNKCRVRPGALSMARSVIPHSTNYPPFRSLLPQISFRKLLSAFRISTNYQHSKLMLTWPLSKTSFLSGATKHRTGLTDRTGRNIPHRRLKRPLTLTLTLRQHPVVCSCCHAWSGRFRRRCGDLMPMR